MKEININKALSTPSLIGGVGSLLFFLVLLFPFLSIAEIIKVAKILTVSGIIFYISLIFLVCSFRRMSEIFYNKQISKYSYIWMVILLIRKISFTDAMEFGDLSLERMIILDLLLIISVYFLKRTFSLLSFYTEVPLYKTGGLFYFIGAILGFMNNIFKISALAYITYLLILIAWAIISYAFFETYKKSQLGKN